ncbi:hypothetical protein Moror_10105 [Moniliophthora roreri MCA 2997]|uniref:Uncharacterized protein n=1 Tax=Moniliophthora roreri (strain MCA 2997) TaxID=1381753 RepID=V2WV73_MONRO|nr:hypothetical protein Moror_10105 [Moniliophthora roreri MCA 2997]
MPSHSSKSSRTSSVRHGHDLDPHRHVHFPPRGENSTPSSHRGILSDLAASTELPSFPILQPTIQDGEDTDDDDDFIPWPQGVDQVNASQRVIQPLGYTSSRPPMSPIQGEHVTYHTNDLGLFQGQTDDPVFTAVPPKLTNLFSSSNPQPQRALQDYERVGGWMTNETGQSCYVPTGHIEEIPDEEESSFGNVHGISESPRDHVGASSQPSPEMLPVETTPPPTPQPFKPKSVLPQSPLYWKVHSTPTGASERRKSQLSIQPPSAAPSPITKCDHGNDWESTPSLSPLSTVEHDTSSFSAFLQEEPIVKQCFTKIKVLCDSFTFLAPSQQDDGGLCTRMTESLSKVRGCLYRGLYLPNEHWSFLDGPKRLNFRNRLLSTYRTLSRLERVSAHYTMLQPKRLNYIIIKLSEHQKKLADIASKLDATFDLLEVCNLHAKASERGSLPDDTYTNLYLNARASYLDIHRRHSRPSHRAGEH